MPPPDDPSFPCALDIAIPFPSARLAHIALRTLQVDPELSPLVRRHLHIAEDSALPTDGPTSNVHPDAPTPDLHPEEPTSDLHAEERTSTPQPHDPNTPHGPPTTLHVLYRASTNRMLRVAVNSFLDSLKLSVEVMQFLDEDVFPLPDTETPIP